MKKIAYILGAVVLATGSVSAVTSFAQTVNESNVSTLTSSLLTNGAAKEASVRQGGETVDQKIVDAISLTIESEVENAVANGDTSAEIQAAMTRAMNATGLSPDLAQALGDVNRNLAQYETPKTGGVGAGTGGGGGGTTSAPTPPPPSGSGSGYTGG